MGTRMKRVGLVTTKQRQKDRQTTERHKRQVERAGQLLRTRMNCTGMVRTKRQAH